MLQRLPSLLLLLLMLLLRMAATVATKPNRSSQQGLYAGISFGIKFQHTTSMLKKIC
jgi:hypothetical protein